MRRLFALTVSAVALALPTATQAGGWATVALEPLPKGIAAGETWTAQITVLRHGRTPTDGAAPSLTIWNAKTGERMTFRAKPSGSTGVYVSRVVFPKAGAWRFGVNDGLAATGYGVSRTTTYAPVEIVSGEEGKGFPVWPLALGLGVLFVAAAGLAARQRLRGPVPAS